MKVLKKPGTKPKDPVKDAVTKKALAKGAAKRPMKSKEKKPKQRKITKKPASNAKEEEPSPMDMGEEEEASITAKNLKTHQDLLNAKLCTPLAVEEAIAKLPQKEQQVLWKRFEKARQLAGQDGAYKDLTKGLGSQEKKHQLLRSFVLDQGAISKNFKQAMLSFSKESERGGQVTFNTWKQQVDKYGQKEAMARLKAGTMKFRKSPTDSRFLEFADKTEYMSWKMAKKQGVEYSTGQHKAAKDDWMSMENLALEEVDEENFGLSSSSLQGLEIEPELKDFFKDHLPLGGEDGESKPKDNKEKKNKWEEMTTVTSSDSQETLKRKLLAFKAELCKDEGALEGFKSDLKGRAEKKEELKFVNSALQAVQSCQKQLEKVIAGGCKKEDSKKALISSFEAIEKSKKAKKLLAKKKGKKPEEDEGDDDWSVLSWEGCRLGRSHFWLAGEPKAWN